MGCFAVRMWLTIEQGTRVWAYRPAVGYIALNLDFGRLEEGGVKVHQHLS